ncbi:hypothetical protein [Actinomadura gamaensis]|uniref:Uncharacterized protein n=1 Tax=Actinomadura gamaensis TaxID=1763541 RepID=A0ABV9U9E5_9ACTN
MFNERTVYVLEHLAHGDFVESVREEGEAEGDARGRLLGFTRALFLILEARGLTANSEVRAAVANCDDWHQMYHWYMAAVTAERAEDILR